MYEKILVPIDGSDTSTLGLQEAIKIVKCQGGQIRLLHVVDELSMAASAAITAVADIAVERLRKTGESILQDAARAASLAGVQVESKLVEEMGVPAGIDILQESQTWQADLIVCGTHGRRGIRRVFLGSDAEYVVRRSCVPVLLVPNRPSCIS